MLLEHCVVAGESVRESECPPGGDGGSGGGGGAVGDSTKEREGRDPGRFCIQTLEIVEIAQK